MTVERRKYKRLKVESGALAALSRSPDVAGQVVNISEDGLSFRYVASQQRSEESSRLNLLLAHTRFHSKALPFKIVWDSPMPNEFSFSLGPISFRQCGVNFDGLTDGEKSEIKKFIQKQTADTKA